MCMSEAGNGLHDMVVKIDKKILKTVEGESSNESDPTSVSIQIGDAIRFVNKEGNITYAIVCGFKPGKKNSTTLFSGKDKELSEYEMDMIDFRNTNIRIIASSESQQLTETPLQFLNVTNLRGIRYLPFTYNNNNYSYAGGEIGDRTAAQKSINENLKVGLKGKFTFSCDIKKIPLLPNGYKYSLGTKISESVKNFGRKFMLGSTQADIGKNMDIPEYSLSSYMTIDKVMTPLNFDPIVTFLKSRVDKVLNDPNSMIKEMVKLMETNGLNTTQGCKNNTEKIQMVNIAQRKNDFITMSTSIQSAFNNRCRVNGVVDPNKAIKFIKDLYNTSVNQGTFFDEEGVSLQTVPQIVYAFNLIPNDLDENIRLLLLALSDTGVDDIQTRIEKLNSPVIVTETDEGDGTNLEATNDQGGGGGTREDAVKIISYAIDKIAEQKLLSPEIINKYRTSLNTASFGFDRTEELETLKNSVTAAAKNTGNNTQSQLVVKNNNDDNGSSLFSRFFKPNSTPGSSGSSKSNGDSCGNDTNIMCNGEYLTITFNIKLEELLSYCEVNPDIIHGDGNRLALSVNMDGVEHKRTAVDSDAAPRGDGHTKLKPAGTAAINDHVDPGRSATSNLASGAAGTDGAPPADLNIVPVDVTIVSNDSAGDKSGALASAPPASAAADAPKLAAALAVPDLAAASGDNSGDNSGALASAPPASAAAPENTTLPTISEINGVLTVTPGIWKGTPAPTLSHQWYNGTSEIEGATDTDYTIKSTDAVASIITCKETAKNTGGSVTVTSSNSFTVPDSAVPAPTSTEAKNKAEEERLKAEAKKKEEEERLKAEAEAKKKVVEEKLKADVADYTKFFDTLSKCLLEVDKSKVKKNVNSGTFIDRLVSCFNGYDNMNELGIFFKALLKASTNKNAKILNQSITIEKDNDINHALLLIIIENLSIKVYPGLYGKKTPEDLLSMTYPYIIKQISGQLGDNTSPLMNSVKSKYTSGVTTGGSLKSKSRSKSSNRKTKKAASSKKKKVKFIK